MLDPNSPLPDISAEEPSGPNLEFDPAFTEFERNSQGKAEQQYGSTVVPAEDPDWKEVVSGAWSLLERTYDLRVMAQLAVGRLQREGLQGYAETLSLIRQVLETRWPQIHPQLDPEDDNDPTLRGNALLTVTEPTRVLRFLRYMPLARGTRAGVVSWRDIGISNGAIEVAPDVTKMSEAVITAAFRESDPAALAAMRAALAATIADVAGISAAFDESAGYGAGPDFTELLKQLRDMQRMMTNFAPAADIAAVEEDEVAEPIAGQEEAAPRARGGGVTIASLGPISNRTDAMRLLDMVVEYYQRSEPSSPLPLLIARARRLADKSFLDLMRDLAPDGLSQIERIAGTPDQ